MQKIFPEYAGLWEQWYGVLGEKRGGYSYAPCALRRETIEIVRQETLRNNLYFSTCRENLAHRNSNTCDGSGLCDANGKHHHP